jgi:hypothetical protein
VFHDGRTVVKHNLKLDVDIRKHEGTRSKLLDLTATVWEFPRLIG